MATVRKLVCENPVCGRPFTDIRTRGRVPKRCPECRAKDLKGHSPEYRELKEQRSHRVVGVLSDGDKELLDFIVDYLGTSKSGAVKAAIRGYAVMLQTISGPRDM